MGPKHWRAVYLMEALGTLGNVITGASLVGMALVNNVDAILGISGTCVGSIAIFCSASIRGKLKATEEQHDG